MSNLALRATADGVVLPVRAQPGARRTSLRGCHDQMLKVSVTTVAEKGKANQAIAELLSDALSLPRSTIELINGETARQKQFLIRGVDVADLQRRITHALTQSAE